MPIKTGPKPLTSWSFSRYNDYEKCPAFFKYKHLMKMAEPGNAAMDRGTAIHKMAEDFTLGKLKRLPTELKQFPHEFKALAKTPNVLVEEQWGFDKAWNPVAWDDWNRCWLRIKMDAHYIDQKRNVLVVIDHKTGKRYGDGELQMELYVAGGISKYPDVKGVETQLWYLDQGEIVPEQPVVVPAKSGPKLIKAWNNRVTPMFNDKVFATKTGTHCRWCHYRASNGGPCDKG